MGLKICFKIVHGYDDERFTPIDPDELEKAYAVFLLGGRAIFRGGAIDGKYIQAILPDWHRTMGWAPEYNLGPDDYNELADKGIDRGARKLQEETQTRVQYLIETKQEHLIGKGVEVPALAENGVSNLTKQLSDKFRI